MSTPLVEPWSTPFYGLMTLTEPRRKKRPDVPLFAVLLGYPPTAHASCAGVLPLDMVQPLSKHANVRLPDRRAPVEVAVECGGSFNMAFVTP